MYEWYLEITNAHWPISCNESLPRKYRSGRPSCRESQSSENLKESEMKGQSRSQHLWKPDIHWIQCGARTRLGSCGRKRRRVKASRRKGEKNNESLPLVMWTLLYKAILLQELNSSSLSLPPRGDEPKPFCVNRHRYLRHRQQRRFTLAQETFYEYVATLAAA